VHSNILGKSKTISFRFLDSHSSNNNNIRISKSTSSQSSNHNCPLSRNPNRHQPQFIRRRNSPIIYSSPLQVKHVSSISRSPLTHKFISQQSNNTQIRSKKIFHLYILRYLDYLSNNFSIHAASRQPWLWRSLSSQTNIN